MLFCDWFTAVSMPSIGIGTLPEGTPAFHGGFVHKYTTDAELKSVAFQLGRIEGSHSTVVMLNTCQPLHQFSGNPSRWSRPDNLFGYSVRESIDLARRIVTTQLPDNAGPGKQLPSDDWRVTRIDLTRNYSTGSIHNARAWLSWLGGHKAGRIKANAYGDGQTIMWKSKRWTAKAYLKSEELRRHKAPQHLIDYCESEGLVRLELTLRKDILQKNRLETVKQCYKAPPEIWEGLFGEYMADVLKSVTVQAEEDLPAPVLGTYLAWMNGIDVSARMSKATFYRHRNTLKNTMGVDISLSPNVARINVRPRIIEIKPLDLPGWYELPAANG